MKNKFFEINNTLFDITIEETTNIKNRKIIKADKLYKCNLNLLNVNSKLPIILVENNKQYNRLVNYIYMSLNKQFIIISEKLFDFENFKIDNSSIKNIFIQVSKNENLHNKILYKFNVTIKKRKDIDNVYKKLQLQSDFIKDNDKNSIYYLYKDFSYLSNSFNFKILEKKVINNIVVYYDKKNNIYYNKDYLNHEILNKNFKIFNSSKKLYYSIYIDMLHKLFQFNIFHSKLKNFEYNNKLNFKLIDIHNISI